MSPENIHKLRILRQQAEEAQTAVVEHEGNSMSESDYRTLSWEERFNRLWELLKPELLKYVLLDDAQSFNGCTPIRVVKVEGSDVLYGVQLELDSDGASRSITEYWYNLGVNFEDDASEVFSRALNDTNLVPPVWLATSQRLCSLETSHDAYQRSAITLQSQVQNTTT